MMKLQWFPWRSRLRFATSRYFVGEEEQKLEIEALLGRSNFLTSYPTRQDMHPRIIAR